VDNQEAFWGNYFNGVKKENPWAAYVPPERFPTEREKFKIFGVEVMNKQRPVDPGRLFMARFGDLARIDAEGRDVRVTLKSGAVFHLDRFSASDFDDGVRVWDGQRGVADLDSLKIRSIEFLPTPRAGDAPGQLQATVRTRQGDFTGLVQWDREQCMGTDEFHGRTAKGDFKLRFDTIGSIAPLSPGSRLMTLLNGQEITLSVEAGQGSRGIYVDAPRYGRVLVSWGAFEGIEFNSGGTGPAYADFPTGGPIAGAVTTLAGRRLAGRLVFDLDESEVTETLDAPSQGVNYTIPFGMIASIVLPGPGQRADVTLRNGEELQLERAGDLGASNAGILIFAAAGRPEYVSWSDVQRLEFDRPPAMYPPLAPPRSGSAPRTSRQEPPASTRGGR
jgi:hypothetical protein